MSVPVIHPSGLFTYEEETTSVDGRLCVYTTCKLLKDLKPGADTLRRINWHNEEYCVKDAEVGYIIEDGSNNLTGWTDKHQLVLDLG